MATQIEKKGFFHFPRMKSRRSPLLLLLPVFFLSSPLFATTWTGKGDGTSWHDKRNWDQGIPTRTTRASIPTGAKVHVPSRATAGSLFVANGASLYIACTGETAQAAFPSQPAGTGVRLDIAGPMTSLGSIAVGGLNNRYDSIEISVGGKLTLAGNAAFHIYSRRGDFTNEAAIPPVAFLEGGAHVRVSGKTRLKDHSTIYPHCHQASGLSVVFSLRDLEIGPDAAFSADLAGWSLVDGVRHGLGAGTGGGTYGGFGGGTDAKLYGFSQAPFYPGSPAGTHADRGIEGGGAIRIDARNVFLEGSLHANGYPDPRGGNSVATGSGGSVFLTCAKLTARETASIEAEGGHWTGDRQNCGGGGRVAIITGSPNGEEIKTLYETGDSDNLITLTDDMAGPSTPYPGLVSVIGGHGQGYKTAPDAPRHGRDGTAVLMTTRRDKPFLMVSGDLIVDSTPPYGVYEIAGGHTNLSAPKYIPVEGSHGLSRHVCTGYAWRNADGDMRKGTTTKAELDVEADTTFIWAYKTIEHYFRATAAGENLGDSWYPAGVTLSIAAPMTYGNGNFIGWEGDVEETNRHSNVQIFQITKPTSLVAVYRLPKGTKPVENKWTGDATNGLWETAGNWSAGRVPGPYDAVSIPAEAQIDITVPVAIYSLSAEKDACLHFHSQGDDFHDSTGLQPVSRGCRQAIVLRTAGDITLDGAKVSLGGVNNNAHSVRLIAGGDLHLLGDAVLAVHASYGDASKKWDELAWQDFKEGGARVIVTGKTSLDDSSAIYVCNNRKSGLGVILDLQDLSIAKQAKIDGNAGGWGWDDYCHCGLGVGQGGAYGGAGGDNPRTYGFACAPFYPGSPGLNASSEAGGGASIRIAAKDITLDGTITANGADVDGNCGSGGAIWITCSTLTPSKTAVLSARGGQWDACNHFCGGGGRIAVMTGTPDAEQIDSLYETGSCENALVVLTAPDAIGDFTTPFTIDVKGGRGQARKIDPTRHRHGADGTFAWLMKRGDAVSVSVTGTVPTMGTTPGPGISIHKQGQLAVSAPSPCLDPAYPGTVRYTPDGFTWTNANGDSGMVSKTGGTIDLSADTRISWNWKKRENLVSIETRGDGTATASRWVRDGKKLTIKAKPARGSVFLGWEEDVPEELRDRRRISIRVDGPKKIIARFAPENDNAKPAAKHRWFHPGD